MNGDQEAHIRARAYEIWENEGRPQGREAQHWEQARQEYQQSANETAPAASETIPGVKPGSPPPASVSPRKVRPGKQVTEAAETGPQNAASGEVLATPGSRAKAPSRRRNKAD